MFLNILNNDEKKAFLELAHYTARVDDDFSEDEELMIQTYCMEMEIEDINYDEDSFDIKSTLSKFTTLQSKKIALLEIMALIYTDGLKDEEQEIIDKMVVSFNFNQELAKEYAQWTQSILHLYQKGKDFIGL